jgi:DNA-directed RNA polymerase specialized sigma24 family protein
MITPQELSDFGIDWNAVRAPILRRMAYHLRGWDQAEIEDAVQDVAYKLVCFLRRSGMPTRLDGLLTVIARRTAVERIRARDRARRAALRASHEMPEASPDGSYRLELAEVEEDVAWKAFQVLEFFRLKHAKCVELAEVRANGKDFKRLALLTNQSHRALLQRWSRCMKRLKAAIGRGELAWTWWSEPGRPGA